MPRTKKTKYYDSESEDDAPPPKKGRQMPVATNGDYSESEDEYENHAPQKSGKVVSTWGSKVIYKSDSEASFTDAGEVDDDADSDYGAKKKKSTPVKRKSPKKKTPAKKSSKKTPAKKAASKKTPAKKTPAKKTPAKKTPAKKTPASARTLASVRRQSKVNYNDSPSEDEEEVCNNK